ncbi:hypothetical protein G3I30_14920 [Actinospica acidiphila]|nr:hypothetical protein [Actinospica acidiphila]
MRQHPARLTCTVCGGMGLIHSRRRCPPCRAAQRLDEVFTAGPDHLRTELAPLREHPAGYPSPYTLISYLDGADGRLIHRLLTGTLACAHDGLDHLRQTASVTHLRSLLTAVGLLPSRDEHWERSAWLRAGRRSWRPRRRYGPDLKGLRSA